MISFKGVQSLPFKKLNYPKIVKKVVFCCLANGLEKGILHKTKFFCFSQKRGRVSLALNSLCI